MPKASSELRYVDETHQYFLGDRQIPSVSKLVSFATGDTLSNVPPEVLQKAAEYGTAVHNAIEEFENTGNIAMLFEDVIAQYMGLKEASKLEIASMEQIITDCKNYAGRYDILAKNGYLFDIKTNSRPMIDKWSWQLSLYYYALDEYKDKGYILYLPKKGKHKVIEVPTHSKEAVKVLIDLYNEEHIAS